MEICALTPEQKKKWDDTRAALMFNAPAFSHVFITMLQNHRGEDMAYFTKDVPVAATDGDNLILNPEKFFTFNLYERTFICAHEILHCIFKHCILGHNWQMTGKVGFPDGTSIEYDHEQMNVAMDLVINAILVDAQLGKMPQENGKDYGHHDVKVATAMDSVIDTYKKIWVKNPPAQSPSFDQHLAPGTSTGKSAGQAVQQHNPAAWQQAIMDGAQAARVQGRLPAGIDRLLKEILEPKVDWTEQIQALFMRKMGSGTYDFRRFDRRLVTRDIFAPGRSGFGAGDVVVAVDTSGSIGEKEVSMFFAEMGGILEEVNPKRMFVMWCDAKVHRVDELEDGGDLIELRAKKAPGGGGTAFEPVFDMIEEMGIEPEALVYLTDGMGSFPQSAPRYPVIWGNIYENAKYPFGEVVDIPKQA
jgi:predicted metal-dependent peptidase